MESAIIYCGRFLIKYGKEFIFIDFADIIYLKSDGEYVLIVTKKDEFCLVNSLKRIIKKLPAYFSLVHRSYIMDIKQIIKIVKLDNNKFNIIKHKNIKIPISCDKKKELLEIYKL